MSSTGAIERWTVRAIWVCVEAAPHGASSLVYLCLFPEEVGGESPTPPSRGVSGSRPRRPRHGRHGRHEPLTWVCARPSWLSVRAAWAVLLARSMHGLGATPAPIGARSGVGRSGRSVRHNTRLLIGSLARLGVAQHPSSAIGPAIRHPARHPAYPRRLSEAPRRPSGPATGHRPALDPERARRPTERPLGIWSQIRERRLSAPLLIGSCHSAGCSTSTSVLPSIAAVPFLTMARRRLPTFIRFWPGLSDW